MDLSLDEIIQQQRATFNGNTRPLSENGDRDGHFPRTRPQANGRFNLYYRNNRPNAYLMWRNRNFRAIHTRPRRFGYSDPLTREYLSLFNGFENRSQRSGPGSVCGSVRSFGSRGSVRSIRSRASQRSVASSRKSFRSFSSMRQQRFRLKLNKLIQISIRKIQEEKAERIVRLGCSELVMDPTELSFDPHITNMPLNSRFRAFICPSDLP